jgi:multicomponent Na+:H+ antiporter subunit E
MFEQRVPRFPETTPSSRACPGIHRRAPELYDGFRSCAASQLVRDDAAIPCQINRTLRLLTHSPEHFAMNALTATFGRAPLATSLMRGFGFFAIWLALIGTAPKDMPFGLLAAAAATWASLRLWPPNGRLSLSGLARFVLRFLPQSVLAGADIARRAMAPRIALRPGLVDYRTTLPPSLAQGAMCAVMSLQPGKLPVSCQASGDMLVHCLDTSAPVTAELAADEAAFLLMLPGQGGRNLG